MGGEYLLQRLPRFTTTAASSFSRLGKACARCVRQTEQIKTRPVQRPVSTLTASLSLYPYHLALTSPVEATRVAKAANVQFRSIGSNQPKHRRQLFSR
eukprot:827292-Amphidinium_carterae.2